MIMKRITKQPTSFRSLPRSGSLLSKQKKRKKHKLMLRLDLVLAAVAVIYVLFVGYSFQKISGKDKKPQTQPRKQQQQLLSLFRFDRQLAETALQKYGAAAMRQVVTAYLESPSTLNDTIPGTGSRGDMDDKWDHGTPPVFVTPLPVRTQQPGDLRQLRYPSVQTCGDLPGKLPVDRGLDFDEKGKLVVWNVGDEPLPADFPEKEAPFCPVEADPFLPWIHDVFPSLDGSKVRFVAQNKRKCRTGRNYDDAVQRLVPQATLLQSVSVQRIPESKAQRLAPQVWHDDGHNSSPSSASLSSSPRYRLAPLEEADKDGMFTRFICRFHYTDVSTATDKPQTVFLGETLSVFPYNYELVAYRKQAGSGTLLSPKGKDSEKFWTSVLQFDCPTPNDPLLRQRLADGSTILSDGTATVHVDLIPIRTAARYNEVQLSEEQIGPNVRDGLQRFNATHHWGSSHVLPRVEASGRWTNIPICQPPRPNVSKEENLLLQPPLAAATSDKSRNLDLIAGSGNQNNGTESSSFLRPLPAKKPHEISVCLWASAEFKTRGKNVGFQSDTAERLKEWLEFHLLVGVDHFYVFDNTGAHTNATSLAPVLEQFPGKTTRIDWPFTVCNNNIPAHDSTGERSSQYAAENACRTRYAPYTEWIAVMDTDEYLVPMGKYSNLKEVVRNAAERGNKILSFRSSRARLRLEASEDVLHKKQQRSRERKDGATFLEAYNCDSAGSPKPSWADRARKQLYQADYVLYHFVHYSTVTRGYFSNLYNDAVKKGTNSWYPFYRESRTVERHTDEVNEAVMVHAKSIGKELNANYDNRCRHDWGKKWQSCWTAYPWPNGKESKEDTYNTTTGMSYNCFINQKVENYWVPRLKEAMRRRQELPQ